MAVHRETLSEDVGGKLLMGASLLAVFGIIALVLMPLGAMFAPPPETPPAVTAPATPAADAAPAVSAESAVPAAAGSETPTPVAPEAQLPPVIGALIPGIVLLVVAAVLAALAGLCLGYAKARADEVENAPAAEPH